MSTNLAHRQRRAAYGDATVEEVMTRRVVRCSPQTPLRDVARFMAARNVHAVFVYDLGDEPDETPELLGVVSDLDLAAAVWAGIDGLTAGDSSIAPLVTVKSDDSLERAAQLMAEHSVSHLAVLDPANDRPAGVISTLDIARSVATEPQRHAQCVGPPNRDVAESPRKRTFPPEAQTASARGNGNVPIGLGMD